jgi:hypothetical protein
VGREIILDDCADDDDSDYDDDDKRGQFISHAL